MIESFTTHPHLYKQPQSRSVKSLKRKIEKLYSICVFAPADKAANNVIFIWKRDYVCFLKGELNSTSTYVPSQLKKDNILWHHIDTLVKIDVICLYFMSKLINMNCLYYSVYQSYTKDLINHALYKIQVTALLPFYLSILHPL